MVRALLLVFAFSLVELAMPAACRSESGAATKAAEAGAPVQCTVKKMSSWVNEENIGKKPTADEKDVPAPYRTYDFYAVTDVVVTNKTNTSQAMFLDRVDLSVNGKSLADPSISLVSDAVTIDKDLRHFNLPPKKKVTITVRMAGNYGIKHKQGTPVGANITLTVGKEKVKLSSQTKFDDAFVGLAK